MFVYQRVYKGLERQRKRERQRANYAYISIYIQELIDTSLNRLVFDVVTNE